MATETPQTETPNSETPANTPPVVDVPNENPTPETPVSSNTTDTPAVDDTADDASILNPKPDDKEGDDAPADNAALFGAPEEGTAYELTGLPEGVVIDADALAAIEPVARELGLSNEGLSKIAGVYAETVLPHVQNTLATQINAEAAQLKKDWATDTRAAIAGGKNAAGEDVVADPVFQGKTLKEVQAVAARALDRFGGEGFRDFLDTHGLGNHPLMTRAMFAAGAAIAEDTELPRGGDVAKPKTREEKYYGASS